MADVTEAEAWLTEKEPLVTSTDYGKDEDSAQAMLKKHNAVMSDLEAYGTVVDQLRDQSKTCKVRLRVGRMAVVVVVAEGGGCGDGRWCDGGWTGIVVVFVMVLVRGGCDDGWCEGCVVWSDGRWL